LITINKFIILILEILFAVIVFMVIYPLVIIMCLLMAPFVVTSVKQLREKHKSCVE